MNTRRKTRARAGKNECRRTRRKNSVAAELLLSLPLVVAASLSSPERAPSVSEDYHSANVNRAYAWSVSHFPRLKLLTLRVPRPSSRSRCRCAPRLIPRSPQRTSINGCGHRSRCGAHGKWYAAMSGSHLLPRWPCPDGLQEAVPSCDHPHMFSGTTKCAPMNW